MKKKTLRLLIPITVIAIVLAIILINFFGIPIYPLSKEYCGCHHAMPEYIFLVLSVILIIASLMVSYYFSSRRMSERLDNQMQFLTKLANKGNLKKTNNNSVDKQSVLKFLSNSERNILEKLIERREGVYQSEISRMEHMTKLKTHRAVKSLVQKGLVRLERHGKTNRIMLTHDTHKMLSSLA